MEGSRSADMLTQLPLPFRRPASANLPRRPDSRQPLRPCFHLQALGPRCRREGVGGDRDIGWRCRFRCCGCVSEGSLALRGVRLADRCPDPVHDSTARGVGKIWVSFSLVGCRDCMPAVFYLGVSLYTAPCHVGTWQWNPSIMMNPVKETLVVSVRLYCNTCAV